MRPEWLSALTGPYVPLAAVSCPLMTHFKSRIPITALTFLEGVGWITVAVMGLCGTFVTSVTPHYRAVVAQVSLNFLPGTWSTLHCARNIRPP
jgi:hypothetical protein